MNESTGVRTIGCLLVLVMLLAIPVALFTYSAYSPHLLSNETSRHLYQYREISRRDGEISLIPGLFEAGATKADVEREILDAGAISWPTGYSELPKGASSLAGFMFNAGHNIACGYQLFILVSYDDTDRLMTATASAAGACL